MRLSDLVRSDGQSRTTEGMLTDHSCGLSSAKVQGVGHFLMELQSRTVPDSDDCVVVIDDDREFRESLERLLRSAHEVAVWFFQKYLDSTFKSIPFRRPHERELVSVNLAKIQAELDQAKMNEQKLTRLAADALPSLPRESGRRR